MRYPKNRHVVPLVVGLVAALFSAAQSASAARLRGEVGVEDRAFAKSAQGPDQHGHNVSLRLQPEFVHDWERGKQRLAVTLFARLDSGDHARTHMDIRELYWRRTFARQFDLYVGLRRVFWGVTETVHLVDIINQTDLVENVDGEDKLGQPMVSATWQTHLGMLDIFVMPYFRERTFPGRDGRLRTPWAVDTGSATYESGAGRNHVDFAVRYSHYFGDFDVGLAHFSGTSRDPLLVPVHGATGRPYLVPHYALLDQTSLDMQYTRGDWAWKLEAVHRETRLEDSNAFVGGFEYTMVGLFGSAADLGLLAEYQYDDRSGPVLSDNDVTFGGRLTFNDAHNTNVLAFAAVDTQNGSAYASIEGNRRVGTDWGVELEARLFLSSAQQDPVFALRNDNYFQVELVRFF